VSRRFLLVGLTGGIATGKSSVSDALRQLGCVIIDADVLAREVVEPGEPAHADVVREFGPGVLRPDGALDRKKLGAIVFADPDQRKRLEALTHPRIRERFQRRLQELDERGFDGIVVFDAPVMIESGNYKNMDRLVVVVADAATQRARALARDGDRQDLERRISSQMPLAEKARLADYVIDNSGDRDATEAEVRWVHHSLTRESGVVRRLSGSPGPLLALFFRNAQHYGTNPFDPRTAACRLGGADQSLSWVAYHPSPPSATVVVRDPGREGRPTIWRLGAEVTRLTCIARTFADLARVERALPANTSETTRGKVVVEHGAHQRNVVVVFLKKDVVAGVKLAGKLAPRIEALVATSDRDIVCLYDRPSRSGSNGQVERAVCVSIAKGRGDTPPVVGTARAMSVVKDVLDGRLEVINRSTSGTEWRGA